MIIDKANLTGTIYDPTGRRGDIHGHSAQHTLGDNDFHIEHTIGNQKIIFTTEAPQVPVPGKPTGFSATGGDAEVSLSWSNPNDTSITKYQVRHKADSSFADGDDLWEDITGSGSGTTSHTVTGLTNGTEYVFQIRAVNAGRNRRGVRREDCDTVFGDYYADEC